MSFLYDPQVMIELVKAAFEKVAQVVAPDLTVSRIGEQNALAKKLVSRLSQQIPSSNVSNSGVPAAQKIESFNIGNIVKSLPLSREDIDFNRINSFFQQIEGYQPNDTRGKDFKNRIDVAINNAKQIMTKALEANSNNNIFSMSALPEDFAQNVISPKSNNYVALLDYLLGVLNQVSNVMMQLKSAYPQYRNIFEDQIGAGPTDDSIYRNNTDRLKFLKSKVSFVK